MYLGIVLTPVEYHRISPNNPFTRPPNPGVLVPNPNGKADQIASAENNHPLTKTICGGTSIISSNVITYVLTDSREMILKSDSFHFNPLKSMTLVIAPPTKTFLSCDKDVRASSEIGDSRLDHGRIGTPFVNKQIWSGDDNFSVQSDVGEADKLVTAVQRSSTDERNTASSRIEEGSLKLFSLKSSRSRI